MNYQDYIKTELLILVPVLYFIGMGLKKSKLADKWIPLFLGLISVGLSALWVIAISEIICVKGTVYAVFTSIPQGVLFAGACVYSNQLYIPSHKE